MPSEALIAFGGSEKDEESEIRGKENDNNTKKDESEQRNQTDTQKSTSEKTMEEHGRDIVDFYNPSLPPEKLSEETSDDENQSLPASSSDSFPSSLSLYLPTMNNWSYGGCGIPFVEKRTSSNNNSTGADEKAQFKVSVNLPNGFSLSDDIEDIV